jgi:hypothetical protein
MLSLSRGLAGRRGGGRCRRYSTPRHLCGTRRCFRARPRRLLLRRLRGSRRVGCRLPPLGGACPPSLSSSSSSPDDEYSKVAGGERDPTARAARIPCPSAPSTPAAGSFAPSCALPAPAAAVAPRVHTLGSGRGRVGPRGVQSLANYQ